MPPLAERIEIERGPRRERDRRPLERGRDRLATARRSWENPIALQPFRPGLLKPNLTSHGFNLPWVLAYRPTEGLLPRQNTALSSGPLKQLADIHARTIDPQRIIRVTTVYQTQKESMFRQLSLGFLSLASSIIRPFTGGVNVYELFVARAAENSQARTQLANIVAKLINILNMSFEHAEMIRHLVLQELRQQAIADQLTARKLEQKRVKIKLEIKRQEKRLENLQQLREQLLAKIGFVADLISLKPLLSKLEQVNSTIRKILGFLRELAKNNPLRNPVEVN